MPKLTNGWSKTTKVCGAIVTVLILLSMVVSAIAIVKQYKDQVDRNERDLRVIESKISILERQMMTDNVAIRAYLKALADNQGLKVEIPNHSEFNFRGK